MKRLLITAALVLALPLAANAEECYPAEINDYLVTRPDVPEDVSVRFDLVGTFLWVQIGEGEILSIEVPEGATGFTACASGDVTFTFPEATSDDSSVSQPVETPSQPVNVYELYRPFLPGSAL